MVFGEERKRKIVALDKMKHRFILNNVNLEKLKISPGLLQEIALILLTPVERFFVSLDKIATSFKMKKPGVNDLKKPNSLNLSEIFYFNFISNPGGI